MRNLKNNYIKRKGDSKRKAKNKINSKDDILAYEILLDYIGQLEHLEDPVEFQRLALKVLRLDYALKIEARKLASVELIEKIPFSFKGKKIPLHRAPAGEASNLVNPETGLFYSQEELKEFKRRGGDVSVLNPPADATFWTDHAVSRIDVREYYMKGQDPLHEGIDIVFPREKAYFDKVRKTQSKPKLDLFFFHNRQRLEIKLKVGAEVYSETTCAALITALGYSADITRYVKDFKVVLGDVTPHRFKLEWKSYYGGYDPDKYIKDEGRDNEGYYIVFYEGVMEAKPDGLLRVGPWAYGKNGNGGLREVRALLLFNMWVSNLDIKESENNKLILKRVGDEYRFFHIQHDLGFSFGKTYMERPGAFKWNLVKKVTGSSIHMNYNALVDNTLFDNISYADARWMARLIARLTRRQISDAVALGGWPASMGRLLVEKLIARRNELVKVFGLDGEKTPEGDTIGYLKFDRHLTTPDGVVQDGKLKVYELKDRPQYFGPRFNEIMALVLKGLRNMAVDTLVNLAASVDYIVLDPEWFGLDRRIVSKIIIRMDREIERNPRPANESETFLVKDTMQIGLRLGYGTVLSGDVAYSRRYTLVYPVQTRDAARFHDKFILNLFLPFKHKGRHLPRNHVVMLEDFLEGRGKLSLRALDSLLEVSLTASGIYLHRRFISFKENQQGKRAIYFEDRSQYNELKLRVFLEFFKTFRSIPYFTYIHKGTLDREYVEMSTSGLEIDARKQKAMEQLLLEGDSTLMQEIGERKVIHDRFYERKSYIKLLGLIRRRSVYRVDRLQETYFPGESGTGRGTPPVNDRLQVESRRLKSWRFFDNGERHYSLIRLTGKTGTGNSIKEPLLIIRLQVNDRSTHDSELKYGYLQFINRVALKEDFIDFDSTGHSINRLWGPTQVFVNMVFYEGAIKSLLQAQENDIWEALAQVTGKSAGYWRREARTRYNRGQPVGRYYSPEHYLAVKTRYFIRELRKARKCKDGQKKMQRLVNAFQKAVYTSGQTYSPSLLAVIHKLVGEDNIYMNALVTTPENKELIFPERTGLYNELGTDRGVTVSGFQFVFDDPSEIYYLF
jgi:hypothetical protein